MVNSFNLNFDLLEQADLINKNNDKTLKNLFKDKISGSFLIKIKSKVIEKINIDFLKYYHIQFDNSRVLTGTNETPDYDICRMIVGVHRHHSVFLSQQEISDNQKSVKYQEQLVDEVIEKIKLREYGSAFFRKKQLFLGDDFLYFPVPYELFVICMRSFFLLEGKTEPLFLEYRNILTGALSALSLMENNFLSNAYPICRGMIEQYLKILILKMNPESIRDYQRFCNFEIEQSCCSQEYPDEFIKLYNNRILESSKSKVDYLHYGWLDNISDYDTTKTNRYSIYGILDYLIDVLDEAQSKKLDHIKSLFKMCHGYTHGSICSVKYPLLQYFEISIMIYYVITSIFDDICNVSADGCATENRMLVNMLNRDFDVLLKQYKNRSTDSFNLYYTIHPL